MNLIGWDIIRANNYLGYGRINNYGDQDGALSGSYPMTGPWRSYMQAASVGVRSTA